MFTRRELARNRDFTIQHVSKTQTSRTHTHARTMHKTSLQRTLFAVFAFIALALPVDAAVYYGIMNFVNVQSIVAD